MTVEIAAEIKVLPQTAALKSKSEMSCKEVLVSVNLSSHPVEGELESPCDGEGPGTEAMSAALSVSSEQPQPQQNSTKASPGPSAKEIKAAEAARARLYGGAGADEPDCNPQLPSGPEPVAVEVSYLTREEVQPAEDGEVALRTALAGLDSKDWVEVVAALNILRQLSIHHTDQLRSRLADLAPLLLKQLKSLRSSVSKTALLCQSDVFHDVNDAILPLLDVGGMQKPATSTLSQLLMKASSKDKKFVIEEAERCLRIMCQELSPGQLLPMVQPYMQHRNPPVRGNAAMCTATLLGRMPKAALADITLTGGLPTHLKAIGSLISDRTPEAREAARQMASLVHTAFLATEDKENLSHANASEGAQQEDGDAPSPQVSSWERFCRAHLGVSAASAVLKATSQA